MKKNPLSTASFTWTLNPLIPQFSNLCVSTRFFPDSIFFSPFSPTNSFDSQRLWTWISEIRRALNPLSEILGSVECEGFNHLIFTFPVIKDWSLYLSKLLIFGIIELAFLFYGVVNRVHRFYIFHIIVSFVLLTQFSFQSQM